MAKLPVYNSQGGITTEVAGNVRPLDAYSGLGNAIGKFSKDIQTLTEQWQQAKDEVENLDGKNKLMMGVNDVLVEAEQYNTWTNAKDLEAKKQELRAKMNSLTPDIMNGFSNNRNAGIFQRNAEYVIYQNNAKLDEIFRNKYQDMNDSNIQTSYDTNFNNFIVTGNSTYRDSFLADVQTSVNAGFMTREQATKLTQKAETWGKYHLLHMAESNPTAAINGLKSGKYGVKPEEYHDTLQKITQIKTNRKLEQEYYEQLRQDQTESKALSYVTSDRYTYAQKTQFIDEAEMNGDISTTYAAKLRRGIRSQNPNKNRSISDAKAVSNIMQQAYDLNENVLDDKEYLKGIQNIRNNIVDLHQQGLINTKDANSFNNQLDTATRKRTAQAASGVSYSSEWKDAREYIESSLPPELRATAYRDVFYKTQDANLEGKSKKEIRQYYKNQAIGVANEIKSNNRAKALQTKNNYSTTKKENKGWAF